MAEEKTTKKPVKSGRKVQFYSEAFKKQVALSYLTSDEGIRAIASRFGVGRTMVSFWAQKYGASFEQTSEKSLNCELMKKQDQSQEELLQRIKELERLLGEEKIKRIGYETMIEVAEKELKIDIRKKSGTKQSKR